MFLGDVIRTNGTRNPPVNQRAVKVKGDAEVLHSFRKAKHSGIVFNVLDPVVLAPSKAIIVAFVVECHRTFDPATFGC